MVMFGSSNTFISPRPTSLFGATTSTTAPSQNHNPMNDAEVRVVHP